MTLFEVGSSRSNSRRRRTNVGKYALVVLLVVMCALAMASTAFAEKVVVSGATPTLTADRPTVVNNAANFVPAGQMAQGDEVKVVNDPITDANAQSIRLANGADKVIYEIGLHTESGQHFKAKYGIDLHRYHEGRAVITYRVLDGSTGQITTKRVEASVKPGDTINAEAAAALDILGGAMVSGHLGSGSVVTGAGWVMLATGYWARTQATPALAAVTILGSQVYAHNVLGGLGSAYGHPLGLALMGAPLLQAVGNPERFEYDAAVNAAALVN